MQLPTAAPSQGMGARGSVLPVAARLPAVLLGSVLAVFGALPLFLLLDSPQTGMAGAATVQTTRLYVEFLITGLPLLLIAALPAGMLFPDAVICMLRRAATRLERLPVMPFAMTLAVLSFVFVAAFTLVVLYGKPNHIDSLVQMLHARFWASGTLAGPASDYGGHWLIQNSLFTPNGWVSHYPPGHIALLALGLLVGAPWVIGAVLAGVTVFFSTRLFELLFPDRLAEARTGAILLAFSPFLLCLAGSFMNHITATACAAVAGWALHRANTNSRFGIAVGVALAWMAITRPVTAIAIAAAFTATIPFVRGDGWRAGALRIARMLPWALLSGAPILLAFLRYNQHFFGSPLRLGYEVAAGPAIGLGFHRDIWGNIYGLREAIGYTSADLLALSVHLVESPLPIVLVIAAWLLLARRIQSAERVILAWALLPVIANFFYWHHGNFMGPRMLLESAPAWSMLFVIAAIAIVRAVPERATLLGRIRLQPATAAALLTAVAAGLLILAPQRALSYGGAWMAVTRTPVPETNGSALVFVHDGWRSRVAMRLASAGMRLDSVETAVRQNSTCALHLLADKMNGGNPEQSAAMLRALDLVPRASDFPRSVEIAPGNLIVSPPGEAFAPECIREIQSDRFGVLELASLLWQGDPPGVHGSGPTFVRDLGPERNAELIRRFPERTPWLYAVRSADGNAQLMEYEEGVSLLWGPATGPHTRRDVRGAP